MVHQVASEESHFPLGKGKGKINEIQYPSGSEYLRAAIQNAEAVGPSLVEPLYSEIFAVRYGPPFGIQVWCPDLLTSYVFQVPNMVCFFEVAFENGLRFLLHPFIKKGFCSISMSVILSFPPTLGYSGGAVSQF